MGSSYIPISSLIRVEASSHRVLGGRVISRDVVSKTKWLHLVSLTYSLRHEDTAGGSTPRKWDAAVRATRRETVTADAVAVLATMRLNTMNGAHDPEASGVNGDDARLLLVRQFRPPVGAISVELPAGLIDEGETPADAALRELREETGFVGRVVRVGEPQALSPGLSGETVCVVEVECEGTSRAGQMVQDAEAIEVVSVPLIRLREALDYMESEGCVVMNGLGGLATGISIGVQYAGLRS